MASCIDIVPSDAHGLNRWEWMKDDRRENGKERRKPLISEVSDGVPLVMQVFLISLYDSLLAFPFLSL